MAGLNIVTPCGEFIQLIHKRNRKLLGLSIVLGILGAMRSLKLSSYEHPGAAFFVLTCTVLW